MVVEAVALLECLRRRGFTLRRGRGNRVHVTPGSRLSPEDADALRRLRNDLLELLPENHENAENVETTKQQAGQEWDHWKTAGWPQVCLDSEQLHGQPHARLFPLISEGKADPRRVRTTRGTGRLLQVFMDRATVAPDDGEKGKVVFLEPREVWPAEVG